MSAAEARAQRQRASEADWLCSVTSADPRGFYAELGLALPVGTGGEASIPCFANPGAHKHDDKHPSCSVNLVTGVWCCHGCGEKGNAYQAAVVKGYSDRRAARAAKRFGVFLEADRHPARPVRSRSRELPSEEQVSQWTDRLSDHGELLDRLARARGWHVRSMRGLGLGWDGERIVFPVRNCQERLVGVARYLPWRKDSERKMVALPGSKRDLFPAPDPIVTVRPLWLVEGEPDAVAGWSLGLATIAVPGAGAWRSQWASRFAGRKVIVCCDADRPGRDLAARIQLDLEDRADVRRVDLAPERDDGYDLGDFVSEAAEHEHGLKCARRVLDRLAA